MHVWQEGFLAEGAWLPQLGDDVVYIAEGHRRLLEKLGSGAARPWETVTADQVQVQTLAAGCCGALMRSQMVLCRASLLLE